MGANPVGHPLSHKSWPGRCPSSSLTARLLAQLGRRAGYGHCAEVYSQLQPYKSARALGAVSGLGFRVAARILGSVPPATAASRGPRSRGAVPSLRGGAPVLAGRAPRLQLPKAPLRLVGPAGLKGGEEGSGEARRSHRGRGVSREAAVKSRAEVASPRSARGPCDVNVGRPRPAARSPAPLRSVICQGAERGSAARPALIYTFPALPLSLLGPGKRVVTFAVNNEF